MNAHPHDPNCSCEDPNARITSATLTALMQFKDELDPLQLSPAEIDEKAAFCMQYLNAADIPPRERGSCSHVLGNYHAHFALCSLANISYRVRPAPDSSFVARLVAAWPDIMQWLQYAFQNWVVAPMFVFDENNTSRYHAFQTIVISLRSFVKLPPVCELILADDGGKRVFVMLGSCWLYETAAEFKTAAHDDRLLTAAEPLLDLTTFTPGPPPDMFFGCILSSSARDTRAPARVALDHLAWYLAAPVPWPAPALFLLDYHVRMASTMALAPQYLHALVAQHAVRTVTRILVALAAAPYDDATAPGSAQALAACLAFLAAVLPAADGFAWTTHAAHLGLLAALLRACAWLGDLPADREGAGAVVQLLRLLALYSMYPSLLRVLVHSVRQVRERALPDTIKDDTAILAAYGELEALVDERSAMLDAETEKDLRCGNPSCRKVDTQNSFSSCSGCFATTYCSSECQKEHWKSEHRTDCKALQEMRAEGRAPPLSTEDYEFATRKVVIAEVRRRKADITAVWRAEPPARTPALSLNYFLDDPRGVLVAGAPAAHPPQGYAEYAQVRMMWDEVMAQEMHAEHIVIGAYLPYGSNGKLHFLWLGIDERVPPSEGSVVERLIKTVEMM